MDRTFVFMADLILTALRTFFEELSGLFFSHFIQFLLAVLIMVMVNIERKRTRSREFVYLTLGFMLLMFQEYLMSTIMGLKVVFSRLDRPDVVEYYSVLLDQVLELFALIILTTAFLYPIAKRKKTLQRVMVYNLLTAVAISLAVFLSYQLKKPQVPFPDHWGAWLFAFLDLILFAAIIFYTLLSGRRSTSLIVVAVSLWGFSKFCTLHNIASFSGRSKTLFMLSETVPIIVYAFLVIAIFRQISAEYMKLHQATLKSKQSLQAIFDGITDGIMTLDSDLKVLNLNESERRFLGLSEAEVKQKTCFELYGRGDEPCANCPAMATFRTRKKASAAFHTSRKQSEDPSFIEEEAFPIFSRSGSVDQVIVYVKDTTARHKIEERMRALDRLAAIGEMSTRVAHEIRNPLEAISGSAEYLGQTVESELVRQFTKIIRDESRRLSDLTENLLNYSKQLQLNVKKSSLNYLVMDTKKLLRPELDDAQARLRLKLDRDLPETFFDASLVKQVIINLLINSMEAMETGGDIVIATSWVRSSVGGGGQGAEPEPQLLELSPPDPAYHSVGNPDVKAAEHVAFYCRDSGKGITEDTIRTIFNPFATTKIKGSGLGLATSEKIVSEHDGMMEVYSREGEGTLFIVRLPVRRDASTLI